MWGRTFVLLSLLSTVLTRPLDTLAARNETLRPMVIWHGMGDSHSSPGMLQFVQLIKTVHPGIFVHSIFVKEGLDEDQKAGWFGNVNEHVELVASQLASIPELENGFDAIGFSQGGQFLRAYTELYNSPPVYNLITFGSQHMGVADLPGCKPSDFLCSIARNAAKLGVYSDFAQSTLVQAQYYRDTTDLESYFAYNKFLTRINNEVELPNQNRTYAKHLSSLENLVLILFSEDTTVVPKESAWFGSYATEDDARDVERWWKFPWPFPWPWPSKGHNTGAIIPMRSQPIYLDDRIGLRTLDESGRVHMISCEGLHMRIAKSCWEPIIKTYVGSVVAKMKKMNGVSEDRVFVVQG